MKNYTFQEWQRFFGLKKNFPADLNTMESTTPKELEKKKAIKGEKNPGNALAKDDFDYDKSERSKRMWAKRRPKMERDKEKYTKIRRYGSPSAFRRRDTFPPELKEAIDSVLTETPVDWEAVEDFYGKQGRRLRNEEYENRPKDPAKSYASEQGWANRKKREAAEKAAEEAAKAYEATRIRSMNAKRGWDTRRANEALRSQPEPKPTPIVETPSPKWTGGKNAIRNLATSSDKSDRLKAYQSLESRAHKFSPNSKKMNQLKTLREEFSSDDIAKEVAMELNKLLKASNIKIVNWGIYGNIGGGKGHKPPEAKMGHPTNKNKRHHTPHTGTGGNVQEGDDGGE